MSVSSDQFIGYTVTLKEDLTSDDFDFYDDFTTKYTEYDQYIGKEKVLLVVDGMNGLYARLVFVDTCIKDSWANENDYIVLRNFPILEEVYNALNKPYKLMYGKDLDKTLIEYVAWFHCH